MCSDIQTSYSGFGIEVKDETTKVSFIHESGLLGCSGTDNYIALLEDLITEEISDHTKQYMKALTVCSRAYAREVWKDIRAAPYLSKDRYETSALFSVSGSDFEPRLFRIEAGTRPFEVRKPPFRVSVGSGSFFSDFLFRLLEKYLLVPQRIDWDKMPAEEVFKICDIVLNAVGSYERNTSLESQVYLHSKVSRKPLRLDPKDIWGESKKGEDHPFRIMLKTVLASHPNESERIFRTLMDKDLLDRLSQWFGSLND